MTDDQTPSRPMGLDERRSTDIPATQADVRVLSGRQGELELRMASIEKSLRTNNEMTQDIRDLLAAAKLGLRVLGTIGTVVQWAAKVAGAAVALYAAWQLVRHGGPKP